MLFDIKIWYYYYY